VSAAPRGLGFAAARRAQALSLGLGEQWEKVKTAYAAANRALGDIVKARAARAGPALAAFPSTPANSAAVACAGDAVVQGGRRPGAGARPAAAPPTARCMRF